MGQKLEIEWLAQKGEFATASFFLQGSNSWLMLSVGAIHY